MKKLRLLIMMLCLATLLAACGDSAKDSSKKAKTATEESKDSKKSSKKSDKKDKADDKSNKKSDKKDKADKESGKKDKDSKNKDKDSKNSKSKDKDADNKKDKDADKETATSSEPALEAALENENYSTNPPFKTHGKLSVNGTKLVDSSNRPFQLRGVSTHGIAWFPQYVNSNAFATIRNTWNCNCIRIAMYSDENNGYCSGGNKDSLKKLVKDGVKYATDLDMYVIIDWHVLGEHDPNVHKDEAKQFFDEMSSLYADYDNVLYEICNEPNGNNVNWKTVKDYAEEVIPVIRKNSPDSIIIVGTPTWSQDVDLAANDPIEGYDNLMYTVHFYADTHKEELRKKVKTALNKNLPVICTEFGICDASGNGKCNENEADKWIELFDENDIGYCIWNLSNKDESSSLIKSSSAKTHDWDESELSQEGKWYVKTLAAKKNSGTVTKNTSKDSDSKKTTTKDNSKKDSKDKDDNSKKNSSDPNKDNKTKDTSDSKKKNKDDDKSNSKDTSSGKLAVKYETFESWTEESKPFTKYSCTINNGGSSDVSGWTITIEFDGDIELKDKWNGTYQVNGNKLIITPESYNNNISNGGTINDIGFIATTRNIKK